MTVLIRCRLESRARYLARLYAGVIEEAVAPDMEGLPPLPKFKTRVTVEERPDEDAEHPWAVVA